jgi:hypothetical protein
MAEHPRSARHVGVLHSAGILRARTSPSHGENRGSSPLGSANQINGLYRISQLLLFPSPIFLQINSGTRGTGLLRVLVPPISYEE